MSPITGMVGFLLLTVLLLRPVLLAGSWQHQQLKRQRRETQVFIANLPSSPDQHATEPRP